MARRSLGHAATQTRAWYRKWWWLHTAVGALLLVILWKDEGLAHLADIGITVGLCGVVLLGHVVVHWIQSPLQEARAAERRLREFRAQERRQKREEPRGDKASEIRALSEELDRILIRGDGPRMTSEEAATSGGRLVVRARELGVFDQELGRIVDMSLTGELRIKPDRFSIPGNLSTEWTGRELSPYWHVYMNVVDCLWDRANNVMPDWALGYAAHAQYRAIGGHLLLDLLKNAAERVDRPGT